MTYNGRTADIEVIDGHAAKGFYCFTVKTTEAGETKDAHKHSIPMRALRERADANATDIQVERDAVVASAIASAEARFKDIVDAEAL